MAVLMGPARCLAALYAHLTDESRGTCSSCTVFETRYTNPRQTVIRRPQIFSQFRSARVCKIYPARALSLPYLPSG